ncbi:putative PPM-type phosphatase, divalent cation binding protein [Helianthus annuus]|uniref:PPM-type phosphatase, divalent cation binding protein n=1 Tax=Helianthus annuus TaxID=4232 RepID=A0A9K3IBZ9_HELAN|nr:putative PPM-type phosphatase, divalent cation binding protein [Helianthus annuus]
MFLLTVFTLFFETKKKVSLDAFMLVFRLDFWLCIVHVAVAYLDPTTSFFGVYDGHGVMLLLNFVRDPHRQVVARNVFYW